MFSKNSHTIGHYSLICHQTNAKNKIMFFYSENLVK